MKKLLLIILLFIHQISFAQGIESGLVAKYCFSGNANDALGAKNGIVHGATLIADRFGTPNEAYSLDGISNYIELPNDTWVSGNFSFSGWIKVNNLSNWARFFEFGDGIDQNNVFFCPSQYGPGYAVFTIHYCASGSPRTYATAPPSFPTSVWTHIAITLSGDTARVYKNNSLWYTYKMIYTPCNVMRTKNYFGKSDFPNPYLDGAIDDIRVYNRTLSTAEVDTIYNLTGCSSITPSPCTTVITASPHSASICAGDTQNLSVSGAGSLTYKWSPVTSLSSDTSRHPFSTTKTSIKYIVKGTDAAGCIGYDSVSITVNPLPVIKASRDTLLCADDSGEAKVFLSASGAASYLWFPSSSFVTPTLSSVSVYIDSYSVFRVKGTDANGCSAYDTVNVGLYPKPSIKVNPNLVTLCAGATMQLTASGGVSYTWTPALGLNSTTISNPILAARKDIAKYFVIGKDKNGCTNTDSVLVAISPSPVVKASPADTAGCIGTKIQMHASGAHSYKWSPSSGLSNDSIAAPTLVITTSASYIVTGKDGNGCEGYDTVRVNANPLPIIKVTQQLVGADCNNTTVQLLATGALNYLWTPGEYADNNLIPNPKVKINNTTVFTVQGTNIFGCVSSDSITVYYKGTTVVHVPNAFTPNNDDINDKIHPIIVCDFVLGEFSIYNRWGAQIYTTQNPSSSWDGTFNGSPCELGVYYYMIKGKNSLNEDVFFKGDITLIR